MHKLGSCLFLLVCAPLGCSKEAPPAALVAEVPDASGAPKAPQGPVEVVRPGDLVEHPEAFIGKVVDVDIVEPIEGPTTDADLAKLEYGFSTVRIPEGSPLSLYLVSAKYRARDPSRYKTKLDHAIESPARVRGEVARDDEGTHRVLVLVEGAQPIDLGAPVRIADAEALGGDDRYDRKLVEILGEARHGFERSTIVDVNGHGTGIWVSGGHYRASSFPPPSAPNGHVGVLFAKKGARYGHLGGSRYELMQLTADP